MSNDHGIVDPLPPQRRVVTGHDANGRSLHASDTSFTPQVIVTPVRTVGMQVLWTVDGIPCKTNSQQDLVDPASVKVTDLSSENGIVVRCVDFAPGGKAMMHRTSSIDYAICVIGQIQQSVLRVEVALKLKPSLVEEGDPVTMKPGDVLIQRGTIHAWYNQSDSWARMHFILMGAEPAVINGQILGNGGYSRDSVTSGGHTNGHSTS